MILDSPALLAIVFREPGFEALLDPPRATDAAAAGAPTLAETGIALEARPGEDSHGLLEPVLDSFGIQEIPFGQVHWRVVVEAFRRYGRGRHPASLNSGDCRTFPSAGLAGEALLSVGDDFARTDVMTD